MDTKIPTTDPYKKTCKYIACKQTFIARRLNMEYCSADCKKKENNGRASKFRKLIFKIAAQLKLNRQILENFYISSKREITMKELELNGFDYTKLTELIKGENGAFDVPAYYNYSIEQLINKNFKITKLW